jgi:hypothetical protein
MDENVRKPMTFLAVVFIGAAVALGAGRVMAWQTFLPDFAEGKDMHILEGKAQDQALVYKVQPGDTWGKVAMNHSLTTRALLDLNDANVTTPLVPGKNIFLPAPKASAPAPSGKPAPR